MTFNKGEANDLSIELACYREPEKFPTGKPKEFHFTNAFRMVWPQYQWNEWCEMMTYAWCNYRLIGILGHSRASKTFHMAHLCLLDYWAADFQTATTLTTTRFDLLKTRMWGDMMRAVETVNPQIAPHVSARYRITNTSNEMKFFINEPGRHSDDKFLIQGVATDSADKTAGKIRGQHADRRRILVDEAQDVAPAIYLAFLNAMSAPDFKGALLTNPVEKISEFGDWVKPEGGWGSVHDTDLFWKTEKPGGICLHFDGLQSPNIKAGKTIFPYLLTQQYVEDVKSSKGEDSLEWWMFVRGFFPPDGTVAKIWPSTTIEKARASVKFDFQPTACAVLDPAFEHDDCVLHFGLIGRLRDGKACCNATQTVRITTKEGPDYPPKDYQIAREVMRLCKERDVKPEDYIQDETGNGRGVLAILRMEWSPKVQGCSFGGEATDRPLRLNDPKKASEQVRYFVAELWFRASFLAHDGMLCGLLNLDPKTTEDLTTRRYSIKQHTDHKVMVAETKDEMKKRLGRSPDYGDAYCLFGELMARKGLLTGILGNGSKKQWETLKKLAQKASKRWSEKKEFAHT